MNYLIDTNVISEIMKRSPEPRVVAWFRALDTVATSVICLEELIFGLRRRSLYRKEAWLRSLLADRGVVFPVTDRASYWSGEKRALLELGGQAATQADALIAACAWEQARVLATRNTKDFEGFGIALFNPFE